MTVENTTTTSEHSGNFTDLAEIQESIVASLEITSINKVALFSKEQCENIMKSSIDELWMPAKVIGNEKLHSAHRQKLRGDTTGFPFMDIREVTKNANTTIYDFNLLGIIDQDFPQIFKYSEKDFYNWHIDLNIMMPSRKITFIVNLSPPADYEGGEIEFLNIDTSTANISEQGSCLIFPSYIPYKINKITQGSKNIIVGHVHGALFR